MTPAALRRLAGLAEARRARDLARLDALLSRDRTLAAEIAALATTLSREAKSGAPLPPAQQALRETWVDQRIRAARRQRAALAPAIAAARAQAVQSLGKHEALGKLVERADDDARHQRDARTEREAPPPATPA
ncbi:hypothetical protein [Amaricoccus sp.]|uniref:hypothetical protein n=1 Tax=Amaricoccus sp. TaxID=1872485 RepID=UPI00261E18D8|nr:hypothetical protein [Amaricoccus sp.]HRO10634.1 hypothetical protein [Amaricoccus sp.]